MTLSFVLKFVVFLLLFGGTALFLVLRREQLAKFYHEVRFEMTKVTWLTQDEIISSTILVLVITAIMGTGCWLVDIAFSTILKGFYAAS